ncbi:ATP--cob(I)alamin adenosyltransferase [Burkholderia alba]|uniref:ATP--cob(I)alamin adenosyltransferase n=1 Tax=Burkholderia alba TaxID=2683677 RepID=UPI002B0586C8|nr:ATP--cob(I)alamin adenosyltransferase [Burkholderia alba]
MDIDSKDFPFVWLRYTSGEGAAHVFDHLDTLLARGDRFVLLTDDAPAGDDSSHDDAEGRKQAVLWAKKNRPKSREQIGAMIAIESDADKRTVLEAFSDPFEKVWGYPLLVETTRDDALATARSLLSTPYPASA